MLRARFGGWRGRTRNAVEWLRKTRFERTWLVDDELEALPALIEEGERVVDLARADLGSRYFGLIALTDRRILFLSGDDDPVLVALDSVVARGALGKELAVVTRDEEFLFSDVLPSGRAAELEQALPQRRRLPPATIRVKQASSAQLTKAWLVFEELERLGEELEADEPIMVLARAAHGTRPGLLAVTDRRVLFLYRKNAATEIALRGVERCTLRKRVLAIKAREQFQFTSIAPRERAADLAGAIASLADAGTPAP